MNFKSIPQKVYIVGIFLITQVTGGAVQNSIDYWNNKNWLMLILLFIGVIFGIGGFLFLARTKKRPSLDVPIKNPTIIADESDEREYARRGMIGLVSKNEKATVVLQKVIADPSEANQAELVKTPFWALIRTALAHKTKLERLWLVPTEGSIEEASLVQTYLEQHIPKLNVSVHKVNIASETNTRVMERTYNTIKALFAEASERYKPKEIICEVTGGLGSMTIATVLASLDKERDISFFAVGYDSDGQIVSGTGKPTIYSFEPELDGTPIV
jgi:hypothetical protein